MGFLKREHVDLLLGLGVLALGLGILLFTFSQALALVQNPGDFLQDQMPQQQSVAGPAASFRWDSTDRNVTVEDTSRQGDAAITSWEWDFGDGTRVSGANPSGHMYTNASVYQVNLIVRDANGKESRSFAQVDIVPQQIRSGESAADPTAGLELNFDFGNLLLPVGVVVLTVGLYLVMALIGGGITKAGWNLVKPRPETIRVRLKPKHLTQAIEGDMGPATPPPPVP